MKPSRTFWTFLVTAIAELLLGVMVCVIAVAAPEQLEQVIRALTVLAPSIGGVGAAGAIALGIRDAASGGLTSSQGDDVAAAKLQIALAGRE